MSPELFAILSVVGLLGAILTSLWWDRRRRKAEQALNHHAYEHFWESDSDSAYEDEVSQTVSEQDDDGPSLLGDIFGAILLCLVETVNCISIAYVLKGDWPTKYLDYLFRHCAYGFILAQVATTIVSKFPGVLSVAGFENLAVMVLLRNSVVASMQASTPESQIITFLVCSSLTTFMSGLIIGLMSVPRITGILNYLPDPLRIGVFAAIGIGIFSVGFDAFGLDPFSLESWDTWINVWKWVPSYALGLTLWYLDEHYSSRWLMLSFVFIVVTGFHSIRVFAGMSLQTAAEDGWVLGQVNSALFSEYFGFIFSNLGNIKWSVVQEQSQLMLTAAFVGPLLNVAINTVILEGVYRTSCNYTREFFSQALANLAAGAGCGWNAYFAVADTNLMRNAGGTTARAAVILCTLMGLICVVPPLVPAIVITVPNTMVAALFAYIGFSIFVGCVVGERKGLSVTEYVLALVIVVLCRCFGVVQGLEYGFVICVLRSMFIDAHQDYLKGSALESLKNCRSNRSYSPGEESLLQNHAHKVVVVKVPLSTISVGKGSSKLWQGIKTHADRVGATCLLLNFSQTKAIDSTSVRTLGEMLSNIQPCRLNFVNVPNQNHEQKLLRRELVKQGLTATLSNATDFDDNVERDYDDGKRTAENEALIKAERQLIHDVSTAEGIKHRGITSGLLGLLYAPIASWSRRARLTMKFVALHNSLKLYFPSAKAQHRQIYNFLFHGRSSLKQCQPGDMLIKRGEVVQGVYILLGGFLSKSCFGIEIAEYAVSGELASAEEEVLSVSDVELNATSHAVVLYIDLTESFSKIPASAFLVLMKMVQAAAKNGCSRQFARRPHDSDQDPDDLSSKRTDSRDSEDDSHAVVSSNSETGW